ncbi:uncharacterized protein LOC122568106 [Bombus pyrosoma]|uniref:uncharacterized protein LOC122568106 n=1 Tax=Bombus pyrosoma TaxID=396416 RepID=UPI001CB98C53|nr:uncharacterized protein LOC122568106 [Bombus pyrosoma]
MPNDNNSTQNEALFYEAHMLREILRINELMMKQASLNEEFYGNTKDSPKSCTKNCSTSTNQNNCSVEKFADETHEIHFQMTSKSVSSLQGEDVSSSTTVFKIDSKTSFKKTVSGSNQFSEPVNSSRKVTSPKHSLNKGNQPFEASVEIDVGLSLLDPTTQKSCVGSSLQEEDKVSSKRIRNVEDRAIGDTLFSYPLELVEIFSNKKGRSSENNLDTGLDINQRTCSMRVLPKEDDEEFRIVPEKNQILSSKIKLNISKKEMRTIDSKNVESVKCSDNVDKISRKRYTRESGQGSAGLQKKSNKTNCLINGSFQKGCRQENVISEDLQESHGPKKDETSENFQGKYTHENCRTNENVEKECAANNVLVSGDPRKKNIHDNGLIDADLQKGYIQENSQTNEGFQKRYRQENSTAGRVSKKNVSENMVFKLTEDQENRIANTSHAEIGIMQMNGQDSTSSSEKIQANHDVNLITIFDAIEKSCIEEKIEKTNGENDIEKFEVSNDTQKHNARQSIRSKSFSLSHLSTFENDAEVLKLQRSFVEGDDPNAIEDVHSLECNKDMRNIVSTEEEDLSSRNEENSDDKSNNIHSIPALSRVTKSHDLFANGNCCKFLSSSSSKCTELANDATTETGEKNILIEEETSEEKHRDVVDSIPLSQNLNNTEKFCTKNGKLNAGENSDLSKLHKSIVNVDSARMDVSSTFEKEDENVEEKCQKNNLKFDSSKLDAPGDNATKEFSMNLNESKATKTTLQHNGSKDLKDSRNLSSSESVNHLKEKSNLQEKDADVDSSKENKLKTIAEKQENQKSNDTDKDVIVGDKNLSCSETVPSSIINDKNIEERDSADFDKEITGIAINDNNHEIAMRESKRDSIDYEDMNVCKMLTKIHERLTSNWQRMERLRMKLQVSISIESVNPTAMLQLLDKTITRCKSYIHGSNDSHEAELQMTNLLAKYVVEMIKIVKINRTTLESQERRVDQMQLELLQGHHINKKRSILNETILISRYWVREIFSLIKGISRLVKHAMSENEEKENVTSLGRCKLPRRIVNSPSINDAKQRIGTVRTRNIKSELVKKESTVETQMSVVSNSVNSLKQCKFAKRLNPGRCVEKEKHLYEAQTTVTDKKMADNYRHPEKGKLPKKIVLSTNSNQCKQSSSMSRQKQRASSNQQPAWRPGGAAKIPIFNSATTLSQKTRPAMRVREKTYPENAKTSAHKRGASMDHILVKTNLTNVEKTIDDNGKRMTKMSNYIQEEKHGRVGNEFKKKPSTEVYPHKDIVPKLTIDILKTTGKRSSTSLKASPRAKPKPKTLRHPSKNFNESEKSAWGIKNYTNASVCDIINERITRESEILRALEEIIKATPEKNEGKNVEKPTYCYNNQVQEETNEVFKQPSEPITVKEEMKINEEEPTRDIDSEQYQKSQLNEVQLKEKFQEDHQIAKNFSENLPENLLIPIVPKNVIPVLNTSVEENVATNEHFEHFQSKAQLSVALGTTTSCVMDINSSSVDRVKVEATKSCQTSSNAISSPDVSELKQKNEKSKENDTCQENNNSFLDNRRKQQKCDSTESKILNNPSIMKKERTRINSHAVSLSMLKEFLYDQGIDVDLVNKAERYLKDRQKTCKGLKKKSISFADVPSYIEHSRHFEKKTILKEEHSWEEKLDKNFEEDIQKDLRKNIGKSETFINDEKDLNEVSLPKTKDIATCTIINNNDAYSQTVNHCKISKCLQSTAEKDALTSVELQATGTQTEVKGRNACSMTESLNRSSPKALGKSYVYKSVTVEHVTKLKKKDLGSKMHKDSKDSKSQNDLHKDPKNVFTKSIDVKSTDIEKTNKIEKHSSKECSRVFENLLNQMREEYDESLPNYKKDDAVDELRFNESKISLTSNSSSMTIKEKNKEEGQSPVRIVSSGIVAALQVAVIRARNVYKALDIYKRRLNNNLKKRNKESRRKEKISKVCKTCEEESKSVSRSCSAVKIILQKRDDSRNAVIEIFKDLRQAEVTSALSELCLDRHSDVNSESEEDSFESVVNLPTNTSFSEVSFRTVDLGIPKKSSSSVVLRNVASLMEFLISKVDDVTFGRIECVTKISNTCEPESCGDMRMEVVKVERRVSVFSTENLLILVYGMLCSVVFWCLNFTISCEVL